MYIKDMKRFIRENMNSYMFNKIRMMAVACGIAIVSGNYLCFGGGDSGSNPGLGTGTSGNVPTQGVDYTNYVKKDIVNGWAIHGQSICNKGNLKDNLDNVFMLKSNVESDYKSKQDLKNIKVNGKQLLSDECDGISDGAKQTIIDNATAEELKNNMIYKAATSKSVVDPSTYVLKGDLGEIKNANNKTLFANNNYTKVNDDYINGLSDKELENNGAFKKLKSEKNNAIKEASVEDLKGANKFKDVVKNLTKEELNENGAYKGAINNASENDLKKAINFKNVVKNLTKEELNENGAYKGAINNASENDLKKAINFKNVVKNLTKEELNETPAYSALVKQAALWTRDKLKDKHFDKNGDEDKTNIYIKADDKTAIEGTKAYKDLKLELDGTRSELDKIKNAIKNAKINNIRLVDDEGKVTNEASNSLAKKDDKVILKKDLKGSRAYEEQFIDDLVAFGSKVGKSGVSSKEYETYFGNGGKGLYLSTSYSSLFWNSSTFSIDQEQAKNIYNVVRGK